MVSRLKPRTQARMLSTGGTAKPSKRPTPTTGGVARPGVKRPITGGRQPSMPKPATRTTGGNSPAGRVVRTTGGNMPAEQAGARSGVGRLQRFNRYRNIVKRTRK